MIDLTSPRRTGQAASFFEMREQAARLYKVDRREVRRHALVSIDNRHKCRECFTCACVEVWRNGGQVERTVALP